MGWENRGNNRYYYRKSRVGGKVVSEYIGSGEVAGLLAQLDRIDRAKKEIEARKECKSRESVIEIDTNLEELERKTSDLVDSYLIQLGFYKTSSREWRLKAT